MQRAVAHTAKQAAENAAAEKAATEKAAAKKSAAEKTAAEKAAAEKAAAAKAEKAKNEAAEKAAVEGAAAEKVAARKAVAFKCKRCIEVSIIRDELNKHIALKRGINSPTPADLKQFRASCESCSDMINVDKVLKNHTCDYTGTVPSSIDNEPWRWAGHR
jgi:predicted RNA-binding Zn-ribbon protein involved in translation (DUF1610 family)